MTVLPLRQQESQVFHLVKKCLGYVVSNSILKNWSIKLFFLGGADAPETPESVCKNKQYFNIMNPVVKM